MRIFHNGNKRSSAQQSSTAFSRSRILYRRQQVRRKKTHLLQNLCLNPFFYLGNTCRPVFIESESAVMSIEDLRHPTLETVYELFYKKRGFFFSFSFLLSKNDAVIPNTIRLGGVDDRGSSIPPVILLTGPNMGGKSTLLRAACLATIMAQVPCSIFLLPMLVHLLIIYLSSLDRLLHPRCQVRAVSCG